MQASSWRRLPTSKMASHQAAYSLMAESVVQSGLGFGVEPVQLADPGPEGLEGGGIGVAEVVRASPATPTVVVGRSASPLEEPVEDRSVVAVAGLADDVRRGQEVVGVEHAGRRRRRRRRTSGCGGVPGGRRGAG